jgi:hypothetical protein
VSFGRFDEHNAYSISRSTRIAEIEAPGTSRERAFPAGEEHGFLWRQNTYWSYREGDGGLYVEIESVSLSRSIPNGLGWAVRPFVQSVPQESLEFTLRSACNAVRK